MLQASILNSKGVYNTKRSLRYNARENMIMAYKAALFLELKRIPPFPDD